MRFGDQPTVWWHTAALPTLLLGSGQQLSVVGAIPVVRRHAGGTAVLADDSVLGLDVFLPHRHPLAETDIIEAYRWLGDLWVGTLKRIGVESRTVSVSEARAAARAEISPDVRAACFGTLSPYEVVALGRKVVGFAQVRRRNGVLLQAGIHLRFDAVALARLLAPAGADDVAVELERRAIGLDRLMDVGVKDLDVISAFADALRTSVDIQLTPGEWTEQELAHARLGCASPTIESR